MSWSRLNGRWRWSLIGSLIVHLVLALLLGVSLSNKPTPNQLAVQPQKEVVQAVAINEQQVLNEIERRRNIEQARADKEIERKRELEQEAAKAKKLRQQEERKIAALKESARKEKIEQQKATRLAEAKRNEAEAIERQHLAKLKTEQEQLKAQKQREQQELESLARQRKAEEQKQLDAERRAEADRQKRLDAERRAEAERQKQLEEERLAVDKAAFEKRLAAEQQRLQQEASRAHQRILAVEKNRYVALIREKVVRNWVRPSGTLEGDSCKVLVHQIPGGEVIDVKVTACSGSVAFRNSVETAVFRASPLPTPATKELFDREIEFTFTP